MSRERELLDRPIQPLGEDHLNEFVTLILKDVSQRGMGKLDVVRHHLHTLDSQALIGVINQLATDALASTVSRNIHDVLSALRGGRVVHIRPEEKHVIADDTASPTGYVDAEIAAVVDCPVAFKAWLQWDILVVSQFLVMLLQYRSHVSNEFW